MLIFHPEAASQATQLSQNHFAFARNRIFPFQMILMKFLIVYIIPMLF